MVGKLAAAISCIRATAIDGRTGVVSKVDSNRPSLTRDTTTYLYKASASNNGLLIVVGPTTRKRRGSTDILNSPAPTLDSADTLKLIYDSVGQQYAPLQRFGAGGGSQIVLYGESVPVSHLPGDELIKVKRNQL